MSLVTDELELTGIFDGERFYGLIVTLKSSVELAK